MKFAEKIRGLSAIGQDGQIIRAAVAAGTHVRFFGLLPGAEELVEIDFRVYWELAEDETRINLILKELKTIFFR